MSPQGKAVKKPTAIALVSCASTILTMGVAEATNSDRKPCKKPVKTNSLHHSAGEPATLNALIEKYKSGAYADAARIGEVVVKNDPDNASAHYYFASALVKLNHSQEASQEFLKAYNRSTDKTLRLYCEEAVSALNQSVESEAASQAEVGARAGARTSAEKNAATASAASDASASANPATGASNARTEIDAKDLLERKSRILEEGANQIDSLRQQADEEIKKIKKNVTDQMVDIPPQVRALRGWIANPEYTSTLNQLNAEAQEKIKVINSRVEKDSADITENCHRRSAAYDATMTNMSSQLKVGKSQIQLMPQNSNPYLRNFVNYDGSIPGALKAKAAALSPDANTQDKTKDQAQDKAKDQKP